MESNGAREVIWLPNGPNLDDFHFSHLPLEPKTFNFLGAAGGTIERSCYSPHYMNTEEDYERDGGDIGDLKWTQNF